MADKRIFTIEINGIKESISGVDVLLEKLANLETRLKELGKDGLKLKIGKQDDNEVVETTNTIAGLRKELAKFKRELVNTELGTEQFDKLRQKTLQLNNQVKEIEQSYGVFSRNVGNYTNSFLAAFDKFPASVKETLNGLKSFNQNAATIEEKIRTVQKSMSELGGSKIDTEPYKALEEVLHNLEDELRTVKDSIEDAKDRTNGLKDVTEVFESVTGAMQLAAGAASLFGNNSEDAVKAIKKMQALQSIANGLKSLQESLQKNGALWKVWQKLMEASEKVVNVLPASLKGTAAGMNATSTATKAATASLHGLKVAIASTGIGLAVVAIGALVSKLMEMGDAADEATDHFKTMNNYISGTLQQTLDKIDFKKNLGQLTELGAARQSLRASQEAFVEYEKELKKLGDTMSTDLQFYDRFIKGFKFDFNTREANDAVVRLFKILNQGIYTTKQQEEAQKALREAILATGKDGSDYANKFNEALQDGQVNLEKIIQLMMRVQQAELDLQKATARNNAEAIANPYLSQMAILKQERDDAKKAAEAQLKEDKSNEEEIRAYINSIDDLYNKKEREAYKTLLDEKDQLDIEAKKNKLAVEEDSLNKRIALINLEEEAEKKSYEKRAKDALISAKKREEDIKKIEAKYKKQREDATKKYYEDMAKAVVDARNKMFAALNDSRQTNLSLADALFDSDELKRKYNEYNANAKDMIYSLKRLFGETQYGNDLNNPEVRPLGDLFGGAEGDISNSLMTYLEGKYGKGKLFGVNPNVRNAMRDIAYAMKDAIANALGDTDYDPIGLVDFTNLEESVELMGNEVMKYKDILMSTTDEFGVNNFDRLIDSITLITNGLYDINAQYPQLIQAQSRYFSDMTNNLNKHLKERLEKTKEANDLELQQTIKSLEEERDLRLKSILDGVGTAEEKGSQIALVNTEYDTKIENEKNKFRIKGIQAEKEYQETIANTVKSNLDKILGSYSEYFSNIQIQLTQMQRHSTNEWNIVKYNEVKKTLGQARKEYSDYVEFLKREAKGLDELRLAGKIDVDTFTTATNEIKDKMREAENAIEDIDKDTSELVGNFISSINVYINAALQGFSDISNSLFDKFNADLDFEMDKLQDENDRLSDILDKQREIVEEHNSKIDEIEGQLGTARGDRRDQLIAALNAEKIARERAYAEEKRIEADKLRNEKQQKALEKRRNDAQHRQQLSQAIVSSALATINAYATQPFIPVGLAMGSLAAALGAAQVGIIASTKYAKGGLLEGKSHKEGGIPVNGFSHPIELEGNEYVVNKKTTSYNLPLLEFINMKKKRLDIADMFEFYSSRQKASSASDKTRFAQGGTLPTMQAIDLNPNTTRIVVDTSDQPIVVSVEEINRVSDNVRNVKVLAGIE